MKNKILKAETLFKKKWTNLLKNYKNLEENNCSGVYVLAYTNRDLEGKSVKLEDIFYVGMTNSLGGLKQRLRQFINGLHKGYGHSAGNRFFQDYSKGKSFDVANHNKKFFVAVLSLPCKVNKKERSPEDLRKMGEVAKFEYEVLAYIKEKLGREPELNKK